MSTALRPFIVMLLFAFMAAPLLAQRTLIHCGTLLDPGVSMQPMTERTLVIEDDRIVAVEEGYTRPGESDTVIDLRDHYVMPGLMDMHTHLSGESRKGGYIDRFMQTPVDQALKATQYAKTTLMAGFTTVRDVGGREGIDLALKRAIQRGDIVGPRMFVAGGSLAITGGHGDPTNGFREDIMGIPTEEQGVVDGVPSAIKAARLAIKRGADHVKITATAGVLSIAADGSAPQFSSEEIEAIVRSAGDLGKKVAAHAHGDEGMQRAIQAGVASIEHGTYMSAKTMEMMKENGVYLVPTIIAGKSVADSARVPGYYVAPVVAKALAIGPLIQDTFGRAYQAGVPIAFGTDAGVFRHGRNAKEFVYMVEAGMPPMEALRSATVHAADLINQSDHLGSLEAGKFADVIAVSSNPIDDMRVLQNVSFVMKGGKVYKE